MPPLPSREALEAMKRVDLQQLCKDYGVRANLKTEALIDLLLQTQSSLPPSSTRRSSNSTRQPSRAGPSRTSSLIIHDIDENEDNGDEIMLFQASPPLEQEPPPPPLPPVPRTRKAKDLQTRLGVGRPTVVGGTGARAVTRSTSSGSQRSRRAKSSRMLSRVEPTIEEEPEPAPTDRMVLPSGNHAHVESLLSNSPAARYPRPMGVPPMDISQQISDAVEPLRIQLEEMQTEMRSLNQRNAEIQELKTQLANLEGLQERYASLEAELRELRSQSISLASLQEELKQLKDTVNERPSPPPLPSTPKARSPRIPLASRGVVPSAFKATSYPPTGHDTSPLNSPRREGAAVPNVLPHPGFAPITLGKRPRDSATSDMTGILEEGQQDGLSEEELAKKVMRPNKKRPRLSSSGETAGAGPSTSKAPSDDVAAQLLAPRIPSFTIYRGTDDAFNESYLDRPPPTDPLPSFFAPSPGESDIRNGTSSMHHEENQNPFNFNFVPMSSTPAQGPTSFMPPFPFPEPPHSPSPAGTSLGYLGRAGDHRTDIFKSFGLPSPRRPRFPESQSDDTINPSAMGSNSTGKQREVSSNEVAAGLGLTMVRTGSSTDPMNIPEPPPAKKTMYGTELEGETRFGDFGVEGVASGFWSGR